MGDDKAELEVRDGVRQLDYLLGVLDSVCLRRAICVGLSSEIERRAQPGVSSLLDAVETSGPMAGVIAALREANGWPVFVVACDMPFLEVRHVVQIVNRRDPGKLATAFVAGDGMPDPMCAIYEPGCLALLEALAVAGKSSLRRFLGDFEIERVDAAEGQFLASVNNRVELEWARKELRKR